MIIKSVSLQVFADEPSPSSSLFSWICFVRSPLRHHVEFIFPAVLRDLAAPWTSSGCESEEGEGSRPPLELRGGKKKKTPAGFVWSSSVG